MCVRLRTDDQGSLCVCLAQAAEQERFVHTKQGKALKLSESWETGQNYVFINWKLLLMWQTPLSSPADSPKVD